MNIEKREIAWKGLTLRSADDSGTSTVEGVAVPFGDIIEHGTEPRPSTDNASSRDSTRRNCASSTARPSAASPKRKARTTDCTSPRGSATRHAAATP